VKEFAKGDDLDEMSLESNNSEEESEELLVKRLLASTNFTSKKAKLMARIYREPEPISIPGMTIPKLDLGNFKTAINTPNNNSLLEQALLEDFHKMVAKGFDIQASSKRYFEENFDELYDNYGDKEPSVKNFLLIVKKLSEVDFCSSENDPLDKGDSENKFPSTSNLAGKKPDICRLEPKKKLQPPAITKTAPCLQNQPEKQSPDTAGTDVSKVQPHSSTSIDFKRAAAASKKPKRKYTKDPRRLARFLKNLALIEFRIRKENPFFLNMDHFEAGDGYPTRSQHESPAKSARSTTTKRRRRASVIGKTLQTDLITMKNSKMIDTKHFDANLQKWVRPIYIFDDDCMLRVRHLLKALVLSCREKEVIREIVYFREDLVIGLIREFENCDFNDKYLQKVRQTVQTYLAEDSENKIKLCFEDTITFLNKVGVLNEKSAIQITNMFRYSNEDIMAIYEVFINTNDFNEFIENLSILQSAKYLEKNLKAQKDFIQGEKTYNLQNSIEPYITEFFRVYFSLDQRKRLTKFINEANEDLIKFMAQHEGLTKKVSHKFSGYVAFITQLKHFLDRFIKNKNLRKMSIRMESVSNSRFSAERAQEKAKLDKIIQSEDYRVLPAH